MNLPFVTFNRNDREELLTEEEGLFQTHAFGGSQPETGQAH